LRYLASAVRAALGLNNSRMRDTGNKSSDTVYGISVGADSASPAMINIRTNRVFIIAPCVWTRFAARRGFDQIQHY